MATYNVSVVQFYTFGNIVFWVVILVATYERVVFLGYKIPK